MPEVDCVPLQSEEAQSVLPLEWTTPRFSGSSSSMAMVKSMWDTRAPCLGVARQGSMALVAAPCAWLGLRARGAYQTHLGPGRRLLGGLTLCDLGGSVFSKTGGTFTAMNPIVEWISQPWPWYVAGPIIGLMVPLHLILLNRTFGISSSFRHMCAACIPNNLDFLKYDWKSESWNLVFAGGVLLGAFLAATFFDRRAHCAQ